MSSFCLLDYLFAWNIYGRVSFFLFLRFCSHSHHIIVLLLSWLCTETTNRYSTANRFVLVVSSMVLDFLLYRTELYKCRAGSTNTSRLQYEFGYEYKSVRVRVRTVSNNNIIIIICRKTMQMSYRSTTLCAVQYGRYVPMHLWNNRLTKKEWKYCSLCTSSSRGCKSALMEWFYPVLLQLLILSKSIPTSSSTTTSSSSTRQRILSRG